MEMRPQISQLPTCPNCSGKCGSGGATRTSTAEAIVEETLRAADGGLGRQDAQPDVQGGYICSEVHKSGHCTNFSQPHFKTTRWLTRWCRRKTGMTPRANDGLRTSIRVVSLNMAFRGHSRGHLMKAIEAKYIEASTGVAEWRDIGHEVHYPSEEGRKIRSLANNTAAFRSTGKS